VDTSWTLPFPSSGALRNHGVSASSIRIFDPKAVTSAHFGAHRPAKRAARGMNTRGAPPGPLPDAAFGKGTPLPALSCYLRADNVRSPLQLSRAGQVPPSVDRDRLTGDPPGSVRREKEDQLGDFVGLSGAPERVCVS